MAKAQSIERTHLNRKILFQVSELPREHPPLKKRVIANVQTTTSRVATCHYEASMVYPVRRQDARDYPVDEGLVLLTTRQGI